MTAPLNVRSIGTVFGAPATFEAKVKDLLLLGLKLTGCHKCDGSGGRRAKRVASANSGDLYELRFEVDSEEKLQRWLESPDVATLLGDHVVTWDVASAPAEPMTPPASPDASVTQA